MLVIECKPIWIEGHPFVGIVVQLPKTSLIAISSDVGYIMCGALDVKLLNERLADRQIVAGRATGVRTLDDLLESPLEMVTDEARKRGICEGMKGREALLKMLPES